YAAQGIDHEVRERDYFFIASFAAWGVWVGIGLAAVMAWIEEQLARRMPVARRSWAWSAPVLLVALLPLLGNRLTASRAGETMARDYARESEEHTSELQSRFDLVCRLLPEKKN